MTAPSASSQREKHSSDEIREKLEQLGADTTGGHWSGGMIENFRRGWAVALFHAAERAHWFERDGFDRATSLCGMTVSVRALYGKGTHEDCANCVQKKARRRRP